MNLITAYLTENPCYRSGRTVAVKGLMLHSVGCPQPDPLVFIRNWNRSDYDSACVHGFIGADDAYITLPCLETKGAAMRGWHAGGSANNTHIGVEMCEPSCIRYTGGAAFTCSDFDAAVNFVKKTTQNAAELFAKLCIYHGLNPLEDGVIISHAEGSKKGIASAHADPEHLWKQLGMKYNMDMFRRDVAERMKEMEEGETMVRYKKLSDIPNNWDEAGNPRAAIEKLMDAGILGGDGSDPDGNDDIIDLSHDMVRTIILEYRGGAFDRKLIAAGMEPAV